MELDDRVRVALYERFVRTASRRAPPRLQRRSAFRPTRSRRLSAGSTKAHVVVLMPGTTRSGWPNPLSAVPTAFRVETPRGEFWGNCIWDGLGVVSMLGGDGTVKTRCPDCEEPMTLRVEDESWSRAKASRTSRCPRSTGGTTSASPERRCWPSGRKCTSIAGVEQTGTRAGRCVSARDRLAARGRLVPRSPESRLATPNVRGGADCLRRPGPDRRLLEALTIRGSLSNRDGIDIT